MEPECVGGGVTDSDSDKGSIESDSDGDNGSVLFKDSEDERGVAIDDGFDNDEPLVYLILRKKGIA